MAQTPRTHLHSSNWKTIVAYELCSINSWETSGPCNGSRIKWKVVSWIFYTFELVNQYIQHEFRVFHTILIVGIWLFKKVRWLIFKNQKVKYALTTMTMCSYFYMVRCILEHRVWLVPVHVSLRCWCSSADTNFNCSASVFGVSTQSMQCSYDSRGNSVPTILLMMQRRLYEQGGLRVWRCFTISSDGYLLVLSVSCSF